MRPEKTLVTAINRYLSFEGSSALVKMSYSRDGKACILVTYAMMGASGPREQLIIASLIARVAGGAFELANTGAKHFRRSF